VRWQPDAPAGGGGSGGDKAPQAAAAAAAPTDWGSLPLSVMLPNGREFEVTWLISRDDRDGSAAASQQPKAVFSSSSLASGSAPAAAAQPRSSRGAPLATVLPLHAFVEERRRQLQWHRLLQDQLERQLRLPLAQPEHDQADTDHYHHHQQQQQQLEDPRAAAIARRKRLNKQRYWTEEFRGLLPAICAAGAAGRLAEVVLPLAARLKAAPVSYALHRLCAVLPSPPGVAWTSPWADALGGGGGGGGGAGGWGSSSRGGEAAEDEHEQQQHGGSAELDETERQFAQTLLLALLQRSRQLRGEVQLEALVPAARAAAACGLKHAAALQWLCEEADRQLQVRGARWLWFACAGVWGESMHAVFSCIVRLLLVVSCIRHLHPTCITQVAGDAGSAADAQALTIHSCCEQLGAPPGPLAATLLRRALADPPTMVARLQPTSLLQLARLAGMGGVESQGLATALCDRIAATDALGRISSDKLALLATSVARMCSGGVAVPSVWAGRLLAPAALRALAGGEAGWGGALKVGWGGSAGGCFGSCTLVFVCLGG